MEGQQWERQQTAVNCVMGWDTVGIPGISLSKSYLSYLHFEGQQMSLHVYFKQVKGSQAQSYHLKLNEYNFCSIRFNLCSPVQRGCDGSNRFFNLIVESKPKNSTSEGR